MFDHGAEKKREEKVIKSSDKFLRKKKNRPTPHDRLQLLEFLVRKSGTHTHTLCLGRDQVLVGKDPDTIGSLFQWMGEFRAWRQRVCTASLSL